jgi:hypothetical protein
MRMSGTAHGRLYEGGTHSAPRVPNVKFISEICREELMTFTTLRPRAPAPVPAPKHLGQSPLDEGLYGREHASPTVPAPDGTCAPTRKRWAGLRHAEIRHPGIRIGPTMGLSHVHLQSRAGTPIHPP